MGAQSEARYGAPYLVLHRGDLNAVLASAAPEDIIQLGRYDLTLLLIIIRTEVTTVKLTGKDNSQGAHIRLLSSGVAVYFFGEAGDVPR